MLHRLHWNLLRALPLPFTAAFATLMFLLLMQFLMRYLPELVGRGLPPPVLVELVAYSLAYMVTLAVPMAWLLALLAVFGRLSESRAYLVVKAAGVSLVQLAWPVLLVGLLLTGAMSYFNHVMLPEANYRMNGLWRDIQVARPAFALEPGTFYTGLSGYALRAEQIPPDSAGLLLGVTVVETRGRAGGQAIVTAERARLQTQGGRLTLLLEGGEVHQRSADLTAGAGRYERLTFARHRLGLDLPPPAFERSDPSALSRSDRSMRTSEMVARRDSLRAVYDARADSLRAMIGRLGRSATPADPFGLAASETDAPEGTGRVRGALADAPMAPSAASVLGPDGEALGQDDFGLQMRSGAAGRPGAPPGESPPGRSAAAPVADLPLEVQRAVFDLAAERAQSVRAEAEIALSTGRWERQRVTRYQIEIYKKHAIALACLVFVLVGVPLGLGVARAGVGRTATFAVAIFLFYWVTLVQGEKLSDRGFFPPWLGMWSSTVVVALLGVLLTVREMRSPSGLLPPGVRPGRLRRRRPAASAPLPSPA
ncbi:MAG: LptF/LptG family permease [Rubricoccaceae bacterium]